MRGSDFAIGRLTRLPHAVTTPLEFMQQPRSRFGVVENDASATTPSNVTNVTFTLREPTQ
jgi:hypothetical protein